MPEDVVELPVDIEPQPDGITCGPTCLHALYRYHGLDVSLSKVIGSVTSLDEGGTLEVHLACDALKRGFEATIYTFNLNLFDPTWFEDADTDIAAKLRERAARKRSAKFKFAVEGYCEFLERGGRLRFTDLTRGELRGMFRRGVPVIAGLNLTYLYRQARIAGPHDDPDDVHGEPCGHFVVLGRLQPRGPQHRRGRSLRTQPGWRGPQVLGTHRSRDRCHPARRHDLRRQPAHPGA